MKYGDIPDYYSEFEGRDKNTDTQVDKESNKNQTINVLTDYEVTALAPPESNFSQDLKHIWHYYPNKIQTPNRRKAVVVLELSDAAMYNCQAIIDKIRKHPNVGYISFTPDYPSDYPCKGTYSKNSKVPVIDSFITVSNPPDKLADASVEDTQLRYSNMSLPIFANNIGLPGLRFVYGFKKNGKYDTPVFGFWQIPLQSKNKVIITYNF